MGVMPHVVSDITSVTADARHEVRRRFAHTSDGYLRVNDRIKDIINSGGINISSVEVENCIFSHPAVFECAVIAVPDTQWGEVPKALQRWEQMERPYVDKTQLMSYVYGAVGTRWPRKLLDLRSKLLPLLSRADLWQRSLRVALDHKPAA